MAGKKKNAEIHETISDQINRQIAEEKTTLEKVVSESNAAINEVKKKTEEAKDAVIEEINKSEESLIQQLLDKLKSEDLVVRLLDSNVFKIGKRYEIQLANTTKKVKATVYLQDANFLCLKDVEGDDRNILPKRLIDGAVVISLK